MGNHNILITNPKGERRFQFADNLSMEECKDFLKETTPPPLGWNYQIVNLNKKVRKIPEYTLIQGFDEKGELVGQVKAHTKRVNGQWCSPKQAKRDLRLKGAVLFTREKIWENGQGPS